MKLKKYYVNFDGDFLYCCLAENEQKACIKTLKAYNIRDGVGSNFDTITMPTRFIVNEQGYESHDNDIIIAATIIEDLLRKEN